MVARDQPHSHPIAWLAVGRVPVTVEIRTFRPEDRERAHELRQQAFASSTSEFDADEHYMPDERRLAMVEDAQVVAIAGVWEFGQFFGGRRVPMGGLASVVVPPEHRHRGFGSQIVRHALRLMHERGEAISTLYPATVAPYRRLGWEIAGAWVRRRVPTAALRALPGAQDTTLRRGRVEDLDEMVDVYDRLAPQTNGMLDRSRAFERRMLVPQEGYEEYVAVRAGRVVGYAVIEHQASDRDDELFSLEVHSLVGLDLDAELALWGMVASHSSVSRTVTYISRPEDPLLLLLPEHELRSVPYDWRWMTRLVDAPAAIAARGFPRGLDATVELSIEDDELPANAGRHVLEVSGGRGQLTPGGAGTVTVDVATLAPLFTGWQPATTLAHLGRLAGATPADVAALTDAFSGPTPWTRDYF